MIKTIITILMLVQAIKDTPETFESFKNSLFDTKSVSSYQITEETPSYESALHRERCAERCLQKQKAQLSDATDLDVESESVTTSRTIETTLPEVSELPEELIVTEPEVTEPSVEIIVETSVTDTSVEDVSVTESTITTEPSIEVNSDIPIEVQDGGVYFDSGFTPTSTLYSPRYKELDFSEDDIGLIALMVEQEVGNCTLASMRAEVCILMNRRLDSRYDWPNNDNSTWGRLSAQNQYSGFWDYCYNTPREDLKQIVRETIELAQTYEFDFACGATLVCAGYSAYHAQNQYAFGHDGQNFYILS